MLQISGITKRSISLARAFLVFIIVLPLTIVSAGEISKEQVDYKRIYNLAWSPDSERFAIATDTGIWVYDKNLQVIKKNLPGGVRVQWNGDGTRLAGISGPL